MPELAITPAAPVTAAARIAPQGHGATPANTAGEAARAADDAAAGTAGGPFARLLKAQLQDADGIAQDTAQPAEPAVELAADATAATDPAAAGDVASLPADPALLVPGLPAVAPPVAAAPVTQADAATTAGEAPVVADDKASLPADKSQPAPATALPAPSASGAAPAASGAAAAAKPTDTTATLAEAPRAAAATPKTEAAPVKDAVATVVEATASRELPPQARAAAVEAPVLPAAPGLDVARAAIAAAPRPELPVPSPLGTRAWAEDVGQQVSWLAGQGQSKAELILTPPHLGRVEVSLSMNGDSTSAVFVSPSAAVRDALEQALPRLREAMAEAGIQLGQAHVSAESGTRRDGDAPARREGGDRFAHEDELPLQPLRPARTGIGMVDLFA